MQHVNGVCKLTSGWEQQRVCGCSCISARLQHLLHACNRRPSWSGAHCRCGCRLMPLLGVSQSCHPTPCQPPLARLAWHWARRTAARLPPAQAAASLAPVQSLGQVLLQHALTPSVPHGSQCMSSICCSVPSRLTAAACGVHMLPRRLACVMAGSVSIPAAEHAGGAMACRM